MIMSQVKKVIKVYPEKCLDCKLCVLSCSITKEGKISPLASRIEIIDYSQMIKFPVQCYHCDEPLCAKICPIPESIKSISFCCSGLGVALVPRL